MSAYGPDYYDAVAISARSSCAVVVPLLTSLIGVPESVVDVGCGRGSWLQAFERQGTKRIVGIDSPELGGELDIPSSCFIPHNLETPIQLEERFGLAVSLEVIEHLPQECESSLIDSLTRLSDVVLFSGAIPGQGGLHHVNEQWQQHWAELFLRSGYLPMDCLRAAVWDDRRVEWWYAQNMLLYYSESYCRSTKLRS